MTRVPANRYLMFALIAGCGLVIDLGSKHFVFKDLGYCDDTSLRSTLEKGEHELFEPSPNRLPGASDTYIDGWLKFRLLTSFNRGALWGIGQGWTWVFAGLSVVAAVGVLLWLFVYGAAQSRWLTVSLAFIMAGAMGNLWDRLGLHGCRDADGSLIHGVRDFLFFEFGTYQYPIFNFADAFLVTGAITLALQSFFGGDPRKTAAENQESPQPETADSGAAEPAATT